MKVPCWITSTLFLMLAFSIPPIIESLFFISEPITQDKMLQGHVFMNYSGITSQFDCYMRCNTSLNCFSMNYYPTTGLCELSCTCHLLRPDDLVYFLHATYFMIRKCQVPQGQCEFGKFFCKVAAC